MESIGALLGLLSTVITALLAAVAYQYREGVKSKAAEIVTVRAECEREKTELRTDRDEWKVMAIDGLRKAERSVVAAETVLKVAKENGT